MVDTSGPAGVVDEDVEVPVPLDHPVDEGTRLLPIADVGLQVRRIVAELGGDPLAGLDRRCRVDHDRGTEGGEAASHRLPDSTGRTRDEDDAT